MNAPFNAVRGSASLRDSFSAFVCDEATAEILRPIAVEHGWAPEKVNKGGLRNAVQSLSVSASPNILFVDLSESGDPLNDINALAEVCEPGTVVIAAGQVNDVRLYRDLVASGIQDYLLKPFTPDQVRDAFANAQMTISGPRVNEPSAERPHVMASVIGVRGGVGASTIATSLAWLMGDKAGRSTALLDLDVHFGTGALALDLEPGRGLTDAIENPSRIDGLFIERAMVRANDKLCVLSAEAPINQPLLTDGSAYHQLQEEMRQRRLAIGTGTQLGEPRGEGRLRVTGDVLPHHRVPQHDHAPADWPKSLHGLDRVQLVHRRRLLHCDAQRCAQPLESGGHVRPHVRLQGRRVVMVCRIERCDIAAEAPYDLKRRGDRR